VARPSRQDLLIAGVALAVALLAATAALLIGTPQNGGGSSASRGEAIVQAGIDANGAPIPRSGGPTSKDYLALRLQP
jgi:hypothetical protein